MKKYICQLMFALFAQMNYTNAQINVSDSLKHLLRTEKQDSTKSILLAKLSAQYFYANADTSMMLAQQGLALARHINFAKGEVACLKAAGDVFSQIGNDAKALELLLQALEKSENIADLRVSARVLRSIGSVYSSQGDYNKALEYDKKAKNTLANIANEHNELLLAVFLICIGDNYEKLNQLDSARFCIDQAYDLAVKGRDTECIGEALDNFGNIYSKMQQPTIAMDNYRLSIPYLIKADDDEGFCESTLGMAKLFKQQGQEDSCLRYAKFSFAAARKDGLPLRVLNASNFLADYYKQHHVRDSAYSYLSAVIEAKDSLYSQEKTRQIQNLSFEETIRQQEIAANKATAEREHKDNLEIIGITAGIIILLSLFLVLSRTFIVHERWIKFLGILGLLVIFEYIYIFIDPYVIKITNESPIWMLLVLILIALILEPIHNRIEHWITHKVIAKNKRLRLAAAKRTVARLENEANEPGIKES